MLPGGRVDRAFLKSAPKRITPYKMHSACSIGIGQPKALKFHFFKRPSMSNNLRAINLGTAFLRGHVGRPVRGFRVPGISHVHREPHRFSRNRARRQPCPPAIAVAPSPPFPFQARTPGQGGRVREAGLPRTRPGAGTVLRSKERYRKAQAPWADFP